MSYSPYTGTVNVGSVTKISPAPLAGSFTAAGTILQAGSQYDVASFDLQGTYVGTVFFEGQIGTSAWFGIPSYTNTGIIGTQTTGNGDFFVSASGLDGVRARLTYSSGTLTYNSRIAAFEDPVNFITGGSIGNIGILSQFPSAAALADTTSNPTLTGIQAFLMAYNGVTWDRLHEVFLTSDNNGVQTGLFTLPQTLIYNGSNWDRMRIANAATGGTGTGLTGVGIMGSDSGGTYRTMRIDSSGNVQQINNIGTVPGLGTTGNSTIPAAVYNVGGSNVDTGNFGAVTMTEFGGDSKGNTEIGFETAARLYLFNSPNANWNRARDALSAVNSVGTGLQGAASLGLDSGGTFHALAVTTGGSIGTLLTNNVQGTTQLNPIPSVNILTVGTSGTVAIGTLVAAPGVGTSIYVCGFSIDGDSTTLGTADVCLSFGSATSGSAVLFRATLATLNDVASRDFTYAVNAGITNSPLTFQIVNGAGTVSWSAQYFIH